MMSVPIFACGQVGQLKGFEFRPDFSFTRCRLTPRARILITGSLVVECAAVRLLGQGKGDGKYAR